MTFDVCGGQVVVTFRLRPMPGRTNEFTLIAPSERAEALGRTGPQTLVCVRPAVRARISL